MIAQMLRGLALALVLTLGLEFVHALHRPWPEALARLLELQTGVVAIGVLLVWAFIAFFHALTNRLWVAGTIVTSLAVVIGAADLLKMGFRSQPLFLTDAAYLGELSFLIENVGAGSVIAIVALLAALPMLGWVMARRSAHRATQRTAHRATQRTARRRADDDAPAPRRRTVLARVATGTVSLTVIVLAATFNWTGSPARALYEAAGADWAPWNQSQNYDDNGLIAGLLYTLPADAMDEPEGYSEEAMADLLARYTEVAAELNAGRDGAALAEANIVVILSESLSDPMALPAITPAEDPLPFLRSLMAENQSGTMISAGYGGGTASVEFEVLTGMAVANLKPQVDSPFQSMVAGADSFPSFLGTFAEGHETYAIHPYASHFYRRSEVYPAFGFDSWDFRDTLPHLAKLPGDRHVSDAALYGEILDRLRETERPMFINAVSMQNHGPQQGLANPMGVQGPLSAGEADSAGQYLRGLAHSDAALEDFVTALAELDEPTAVLLYGDHLPALWPAAVLDSADPLARYSTPWVVFANFPLQGAAGGGNGEASVSGEGAAGGGDGEASVSGEGAASVPLGANQLMNQLVDAAGGEHTPWTALLHTVGEELPAMGRTAWIGAGGERVSEADLPPEAAAALADYRMAQYDLTVGEGWAAEELFGVAR